MTDILVAEALVGSRARALGATIAAEVAAKPVAPYSASWLRLCARFAPLLAVTSSSVLLRVFRAFAPRTAPKYFSALGFVARWLGRPPPPDEQQIARTLLLAANAAPLDEQFAATTAHVMSMLAAGAARSVDDRRLLLAASLAFAWGQRACDVLRLRAADVLSAPLAGCSGAAGWTATFVYHKTAARVQPYVLAAPFGSLAAAILGQAVELHRRVSPQSAFLFSSEPSAAAVLAASSPRLLLAMRRVCREPRLTQRALRRGGLQLLAETASTEALLLFSRHRSRDMLNRYLCWGRLHGAEIRQQVTTMLGAFGPQLSVDAFAGFSWPGAAPTTNSDDDDDET